MAVKLRPRFGWGKDRQPRPAGSRQVASHLQAKDFARLQRVTAARGESISEFIRRATLAELDRTETEELHDGRRP